MKKNSQRQAPPKGRPVAKKGHGSKKKRKDDSRLEGFKTLQQVAGGPKPYKFHSRIPVPEARVLNEPHDTCPICGRTIDNISGAMCSAQGYVHFDCALESVRASSHLAEGDKLSYIGRGSFGICAKDEDGKWYIKERISYEDQASYDKMKAYVEEHRHG